MYAVYAVYVAKLYVYYVYYVYYIYRGFPRSTVVYLRTTFPTLDNFPPCSDYQNIIRVNLLGNHSTSYYVDLVY